MPQPEQNEAPESVAAEVADAVLRVVRWMEGVDRLNWDEIVADGGVTCGMVIQQELRLQASRLRAVALLCTPALLLAERAKVSK